MKKQTKHIKQKWRAAFLGLSLLSITTVAQTPATSTFSPLLMGQSYHNTDWTDPKNNPVPLSAQTWNAVVESNGPDARRGKFL